MSTIDKSVAKTISPDHTTRMNDDVIADLDVGIEHRTWVQHHVVTDRAAISHHHSRMNVTAVSDGDVGTNDRMRVNIGVCADAGRIVNNCVGRDSDVRTLPGWSQQTCDCQKCGFSLWYQHKGSIVSCGQFITHSQRDNNQAGC